MKKHIIYTLCLCSVSAFYACKDEAVKPEVLPIQEPSLAVKLAPGFTAARYEVVVINPEIVIENENGAAPEYKWSIRVTDKDGALKDSVIGNLKTLDFIAPKAEKYTVDLTVTSGKLTERTSTEVLVSESNKTYNSRALSVLDYLPSPSYTIDNYSGLTKTEALALAREELNNESSVPLGTFGGYIVTAFDHTVINVFGKRDFMVQMNSASGLKFSPGSIYVAYDTNKNGVPDENEWYEIAGSEHHKSTTIKNYEMTYYKPDPDQAPSTGAADWQYDTAYMKWTDNKNASGNITRTKKWRRYNYYPSWMGDSYTVAGTKLTLPVKDVSDGAGLTWNVGTYDWGYGGIKDPSIDISWAVDKSGKKVHLPGIDFIKVYVPTYVELGSLNLLTNSYEYAEDLNMK